MQKFALLSSGPVTQWQEAIVGLLEETAHYKVTGAAVVLMVEPEEPDGDDVIAFYHRMSIRDKQLAASVIEGDVHYAIAEDAIRHYLGDEDDEEE